MEHTEVKGEETVFNVLLDKYSFKDPLAQIAPRRKGGKNDKVLMHINSTEKKAILCAKR